MNKLNIEQDPTAVYQDNNGAIGWAQRGPAKNCSRRKQIDITHHYVMGMVVQNQIAVIKVPTTSMHADFLTKTMGPSKFQEEMQKVALCQ